MPDETVPRRYQLRQRADAMKQARRRITEAAVELHGSVGPARTTSARSPTVADLAERLAAAT